MRHTHKKFKIRIKPQVIFEKVYRVIKFNQKAWLKPYIDMNTDLKNSEK